LFAESTSSLSTPAFKNGRPTGAEFANKYITAALTFAELAIMLFLLSRDAEKRNRTPSSGVSLGPFSTVYSRHVYFYNAGKKRHGKWKYEYGEHTI